MRPLLFEGSTKLRVLRAHVQYLPLTLRAPVIHVNRVLYASSLHVLRVLHALLPHRPRALVLPRLTCLVHYLLSCLTCLVPCMTSCLTCFLHFHMSCLSYFLCTLVNHVLSCFTRTSCLVLRVLHLLISPFVFLLSHASRDFFYLFSASEIFWDVYYS